MKSFWRISISSLAVVLSCLISVKPMEAQSQNPKAMVWFEIGFGEKDLQKKIEAYSKAIAEDSTLTEALYNLGLAYRQTQDYMKAEKYLLKALKTKPAIINSELKIRIHYALAVVYKKLGKLELASETIVKTKVFVNNNKVLATLSSELAMLLFELERYEEALKELQASITLNPMNHDKFTGLMNSIESKLELQRLYKKAERAQAIGNLTSASILFKQIKNKDPGFKDVKERISELDSIQLAESQEKVLARMYNEAQKYENEGSLEMAISTYEELLTKSSNYKDAGSRLNNLRQQLQQKQPLKISEGEDAIATAAQRAKDWAKVPETQTGLEQQSMNEMAARYYTEGVIALNNDEMAAALEAFEKVQEIDPNYRNTGNLIENIEKLFEPTSTTTASSIAYLDSLYESALDYIAREEWPQATYILKNLQYLQPNYRNVNNLLADVENNLNFEIRPVNYNSQKNNSALYLGIIAGIIGLPLLVILFLPQTRARLYLARGNYGKAASQYEKILMRHSDRLNVYPILADIYLRLGRKDPEAIKVFKMILQLKLATSQREEINSLVTQHDLSGREEKNSPALEILEKALKQPQNNQTSQNNKNLG